MAMARAMAEGKRKSRVKFRLALSSSPSPRVAATRALPPEPNMKPMELMTMMIGYTMFTAARAPFPTKFDTKYPSITR